MKAQGATEYLVLMSVVLGIALICVALLVWPTGTTKDVKQSETDIKYKIRAMEHPELTQGLVAYYKFDEGVGDSASNSVGNVNYGTLSNGVAWEDGKSGKATSFDGTGGAGGSGSCVLFDAPNVTGSITIGFWYKPKTVSTIAGVIEKYDGSGGTNPYEVYRSNNAIVFRIMNATGQSEDLSSGTVLSAGNWHYVAATYDGSYKRVYINGLEKASAANSGAITTNAFRGAIGSVITAGGACGGWYDNSTIDDVRIYIRALSAEEISLLYNNPGYP